MMAPHIFSSLKKGHHHDRRLSFDSLNQQSDTEEPTPPQIQESKAIHGKNNDAVHTSSLLGDTPEATTMIKTAAPNALQVWWFEGLTCLLAVGMLAAVVATIRPYQNEPLPQWPYDLSINTLVAIYFVILKISLAFVLSQLLGQLKWREFERPQPLDRLAQYDDASRGPWGSLMLLWSLRGRSFLPSAAAVILVLATIMDPFGQQIISFYSCPIQDTTKNATVPLAHSLNAGMECQPRGIRHAGCSLTGDMQAAIQLGMFQSNPSPPSFSCPTGTVTLTLPMGALGGAAQCADVSDRLLLSTERNVLKVSKHGDMRPFDRRNFTLPPHPQYKSLYGGDLNYTLSVLTRSDENKRGYGWLHARSFGYIESSKVVVQFILGHDDTLGSDQPDNLWRTRGYGAAECSIYPCLRKYKSKIRTGDITEEILSETADQWGSVRVKTRKENESSSKPFSGERSIEVSCLNETEIEDLKQHGYSFEGLDPSMAWLKYNWTRVESPVSQDLNDTRSGDNQQWLPVPEDVARIRRECIHEFHEKWTWNVAWYLSSVFNHTLEIDVMDGTTLIGPPYLQTIYQGGKISYAAVKGAIDRVAHALTKYQRDTPAAADNSAIGIVFKKDTCVRVEWAWIIFPSALVAGLLITMMATLVRVSTGNPLARQNYKTSLLPLMFHSLERQDTYTTGLETMNKMESEAKTLRVRLEPTDRGWRFRES